MIFQMKEVFLKRTLPALLFSLFLLHPLFAKARASGFWLVSGKIVSKKLLTQHMFRLTVRISQPHLFTFLPAQWCFLSFREHQARPYSMASSMQSLKASGEVNFVMSTRRPLDDIASYGNESLSEEFFVSHPDEPVNLSGPMGHSFRFDRSQGSNLVFVTKGSGIAPVIPVLESLVSTKKSSSDSDRIHLVLLEHNTSPVHEIHELLRDFTIQIPNFSWQIIRRDHFRESFDSVCSEIIGAEIFSNRSTVYVSGSQKLSTDLKKILGSPESSLKHKVYGEMY